MVTFNIMGKCHKQHNGAQQYRKFGIQILHTAIVSLIIYLCSPLYCDFTLGSYEVWFAKVKSK